MMLKPSYQVFYSVLSRCHQFVIQFTWASMTRRSTSWMKTSRGTKIMNMGWTGAWLIRCSSEWLRIPMTSDFSVWTRMSLWGKQRMRSSFFSYLELIQDWVNSTNLSSDCFFWQNGRQWRWQRGVKPDHWHELLRDWHFHRLRCTPQAGAGCSLPASLMSSGLSSTSSARSLSITGARGLMAVPRAGIRLLRLFWDTVFIFICAIGIDSG